MSKIDEIINKSLDDIDAIVEEIKKGNNEGDISKAVGDEDLAPGDISEDAPEAGEDPAEDGAEQGAEGAEEAGEGGDPDADSDTDEEPEENEQEDEEVEKSLEDSLKANDSVKKALEVSEFLDQLVKGISNDLLSQRTELSKSIQSTSQATELLAKSFEGIAKSQRVVLETQAQLLKSIRTLNSRMQKLESQPQGRKSVASTAQVVEKSFAGQAAPTGVEGLSKAQVSAKLFQGVQEGKIESTELFAYESLGAINALSPQAQAYLNSK